MNQANEEFLDLLEVAVAAGAITMLGRDGQAVVTRKDDGSPVTDADEAAEAFILHEVRSRFPHIPIIAEEEVAAGKKTEIGSKFFLIDPLDGTKEYIKGGTDFTVNIGLIENGNPVFGIVYAPALGMLYWGNVARQSAYCVEIKPDDKRASPAILAMAKQIRCRQTKSAPRAVASKSHNSLETESYLANVGAQERLSIGSSLKFLLVASGKADVYPRAGATMEWDIAAGDAVLRAAGGMTFDLDGKAIAYGKKDFFNPGFVAAGLYDPPPLGEFFSGAEMTPKRG